LPKESSASHRIAAVTPEPQLVITGLSRSTPLRMKAARIFSGEARRPFSTTSVDGTLKEPGMWPERSPGLGSAA
jgi:hypothetical protein